MASEGLDRAALESLYVRLEGPLYSAVYRWLWSPEDSREVVQEGFMRLWAMRDRVDMSTVEALLWRITLNRAATRRRRARLLTWVGLKTEPAVDAAQPLERQQREVAVRAAVDALPEKQRQVVMMTAFSDLSYAQVAHVLQIPEGTVASRRSVALKTLREVLDGADL